jgi:phage gp16-like protein
MPKPVKTPRPLTLQRGQRASDLAKIHIAKTQLALSDDDYRDLLARLTGHRSAADLNAAQRTKVLDHFRAVGWQDTGRQAKLGLANTPQMRKIAVLWHDLHAAGLVRSPTAKALHHWIKRQTTGADAINLDERSASACIEALKAWLSRGSPPRSTE